MRKKAFKCLASGLEALFNEIENDYDAFRRYLEKLKVCFETFESDLGEVRNNLVSSHLVPQFNEQKCFFCELADSAAKKLFLDNIDLQGLDNTKEQIMAKSQEFMREATECRH